MTLASIVAIVQLVPAAVIAPIASAAGDGADRGRLLVLGYLGPATAMAAGAVALTADAPPVAVVALAAVVTTALTVTRPLQGALLPDLSRSPAELVAANSIAGLAGVLAWVVGPLAIAGLLSVGGPDLVFFSVTPLPGGHSPVVRGPLRFEDFVDQHGRRVVGLAYTLSGSRRRWRHSWRPTHMAEARVCRVLRTRRHHHLRVGLRAGPHGRARSRQRSGDRRVGDRGGRRMGCRWVGVE